MYGERLTLRISDERVLSDDVQTAEDVDDNLYKASSDQSPSEKDCDEVLVNGPREVDQECVTGVLHPTFYLYLYSADTEEFIVEDSSFAKADVDYADDDESEAEDMPDDALISWTQSLKGRMSPDWYEAEDEDVEESECVAELLQWYASTDHGLTDPMLQTWTTSLSLRPLRTSSSSCQLLKTPRSRPLP